MASAIMVASRRQAMQDRRCTREKEDLRGLEKTEIHRWESRRERWVSVKKRCWKSTRSWRPATGSIRSTLPSSSSTASHRLHRKM